MAGISSWEVPMNAARMLLRNWSKAQPMNFAHVDCSPAPARRTPKRMAIRTSVPGEYTFTSQLDVREGDGGVKAGLIVVEGWVDLVHGQVVLGPSSGVLCARR